MRVLSICNLKGGVAKTTSAVNTAGIMAVLHGKRVLVIDNDQQGNASQFFQVFDPDGYGTPEVLTMEADIRDLIKRVEPGLPLDVLPCNMNLAETNRRLMIQLKGMPKEIRLREALKDVAADYDYCIIDNGPNLDYSFANAIVASDDFIVPIKIDKYSFNGIKLLMEFVKGYDYYTSGINFVGCLPVMIHTGNRLEQEGMEWLKNGNDSTGHHEYRMMKTRIRYSPKVNESTFSSRLLLEESARSQATINYKQLAVEYMNEVAEKEKVGE